ncbi:MAG: type II toxin-antitoxin system Phd/YefM family antitoxin [Clostridiaceae bacterium]|nr:type II toxin-antitoxin system Phd/YefM family antitoxin [Clostridiaceae bacterium]
MPRIIPIRDLKDTSAISQLCNESEEPIYITKNGYGDMVIMSMKVYREKLLMLDIYDKLSAAENEVKTGKVSDARISLAEMRRKYEL